MSHPAQQQWKIAIVIVLTTTAGARAAQFASKVISYSPGAGVGAAYQNAVAALGSPESIVGQSIGFPNVLSPFSPAFEPSQIVQIGGGGQLTLELSHYALVGAGPRIGVVSNVGLIDATYPTGHAGNPAGIFGGGSAIIEVSQDGSHWTALGGGNPLLLNMPAMFYVNAGPYDPAPPAGAVASDFGLPFSPAGGLSAFDNLNYSQVIGLLGGAGGGTWLDLSATGLAQVGYIRFSVPSGGNKINLDAVSIANTAVGAVVPEPSGATLLIVGAGLAWFCRRRIATPSRESDIARAGLILLVLSTLAAGSQATEIMSENFANDPVAAGRSTVTGDSSRFVFSPSSLTAHYDSLLSTTKMAWPLAHSLNQSTDFRFDVTFKILGKDFFADPNKFGQISLGLINSATTGPDRAGANPSQAKAFDLVNIDYFPNISPTFGGPTLSPTVIQSDNGSGFFNRVLFPSDSESLLDDPGESDLPRDSSLTAEITYLASSRLVTLRMMAAGGPLPINVGGGKANLPGGPDGDPTTIQLTLPPTAVFSVDSFALPLWNDSFTGTTSSVRADLVFTQIHVFDAVVPEPSAPLLAMWGVISLLVWRARSKQTGCKQPR